MIFLDPIGGLVSKVNVEQKSDQTPPQMGLASTFSHRRRYRTISSILRKIFGGRILSKGDKSGAPGYIQIANTWLIVNVGGGPTPTNHQ